MIDAVAQAVGREAADVRIDNMVPPSSDAVPLRHPQALRQRRLSGMRAPRRRRHRCAEGANAATTRRGGRPYDRRRARELHRADRPWHRRMGRARPPRRIRLRARARAPHPGRQAGPVRRDPEPWPGARNDARAGRVPGARNRRRGCRRAARGQRGFALRNGHVRIAQHDHGGRSGSRAPAPSLAKRSNASARICCRRQRIP